MVKNDKNTESPPLINAVESKDGKKYPRLDGSFKLPPGHKLLSMSIGGKTIFRAPKDSAKSD